MVSNRMAYFRPVGKLLAHLCHGLVDLVGNRDGIGVGQGENDDLGGLDDRCRSAKLLKDLLAQFHAGDIAQTYDLRGRHR